MFSVVMCVVCSFFYVQEGGSVVDPESLSLPLLWTQPHVGINPTGHPNYKYVTQVTPPKTTQSAM